MNFDRLRYLAAVARTGSVRGAAASLHVTPGAVSKALARLESESGVPLVVPQGRGIELTRDGRWLAGRADYLVSEFASLRDDLRHRRTHDAGICLASYDVFSTWFPGQLAARFLPGVQLSVRDLWPGEVEEAVATGLSDVGITFVPVRTEGIEHREIKTVPLGVYVRRGAFAGESFDQLPFVVPAHPVHGSVGRHGPLDGWPLDAPQRQVHHKASSLEARLELCRSGVAAALLPRFVAQMHDHRVRASLRLDEVVVPRSIGRMARRVYVVMRPASSGELQRRIDSVTDAVRTACAVT